MWQEAETVTKFKALIGKHWGWQLVEASRFWPVKKYTLLFIANPNPTPKFVTSKYKHKRISILLNISFFHWPPTPKIL